VINKLGRFKRFLGEISLKVGGEELNLGKMTVEDIQKLVDLSKVKENEIVNGVRTITEIVAKGYPDEPKEEIEAFVLKNYTAITEEIIIALGWTTRDKLEETKKDLGEKKN
jgi:hypothetical protein